MMMKMRKQFATDFLNKETCTKKEGRNSMANPSKDKTSFQITISKRVKQDLDGITQAINDMLEKKGEAPLTRSQVIEKILVGFIISSTMTKEEQEKALEEAEGGNKNA